MPGGGSWSREVKEEKRSATSSPLTGSAGQVAQRPKMATLLSPSVAMFQIAGTFRSLLGIGSSAPVAGLRRVKSRMPCSSGEAPVIIVVQTSGESGGWIVFSVAVRPSRARAARLGIMPAAM